MTEPVSPEPDPNQDPNAPHRAVGGGIRPHTPAQRLARKTQSLDILYEVATSLSQPGRLEKLLEGFLDTFIELVDARAACVRLLSADGFSRIVASRGLAPDVLERDGSVPAAGCLCGWCSIGGGVRVEKGTRACARRNGRPMLEPDCEEFVVIPVQYQDRILGVYNLFLDRPLAALGEDMHDLLISVGRQLGLAVEKARLETDARRLAIMEERNLIGNELHDSLAQSLIGMRLQLKILSESLARKDLGAAQVEANGLRRAITQANEDVRDLLTNYRLRIDESGLLNTLTKLVGRFQRETGIAVFFQNECEMLGLLPGQELQLFFIIQEALTNIRKHSGAQNVRIMLNNEGDLYTVLIEDDGLGMEGETENMPVQHAGLAIMRERTAKLPGQIVIESEPGEGTRIVLIFTAPPLAWPEPR